MGSLAFLAMIGTYVAVLYWYALNYERDEDGRGGVLGVKEADPSLIKERVTRERQNPNALKRASGSAKPTTSATNIRERVKHLQETENKDD